MKLYCTLLFLFLSCLTNSLEIPWLPKEVLKSLAKSLLKIKGCLVDEGKVLQDAVLLEEALEWRQKLEDLESTKQQEQFKVDLQNAIKSCEHDFSQAWDQQDQQTLQQAYLRLSYLMKTLKTYLHKINSQAQQSLLKKLKSASSNI